MSDEKDNQLSEVVNQGKRQQHSNKHASNSGLLSQEAIRASKLSALVQESMDSANRAVKRSLETMDSIRRVSKMAALSEESMDSIDRSFKKNLEIIDSINLAVKRSQASLRASELGMLSQATIESINLASELSELNLEVMNSISNVSKMAVLIQESMDSIDCAVKRSLETIDSINLAVKRSQVCLRASELGVLSRATIESINLASELSALSQVATYESMSEWLSIDFEQIISQSNRMKLSEEMRGSLSPDATNPLPFDLADNDLSEDEILDFDTLLMVVVIAFYIVTTLKFIDFAIQNDELGKAGELMNVLVMLMTILSDTKGR